MRPDGAPGANDCFRPPDIPVEVFCAHCQQEYESYLIHWVQDRSYSNGGYWACPTPGCDGKGFTFDIWPTDPDWTDEYGNKVCFFDDSDAVEDDWAADMADVGDEDELLDDPDDPCAQEDPTVQILNNSDQGLLIPDPPDDGVDLEDDSFSPLELDDELTWGDDEDSGLSYPAHRIRDTLEFHPDDDLP